MEVQRHLRVVHILFPVKMGRSGNMTLQSGSFSSLGTQGEVFVSIDAWQMNQHLDHMSHLTHFSGDLQGEGFSAALGHRFVGLMRMWALPQSLMLSVLRVQGFLEEVLSKENEKDLAE
ncbi:hypothetical protein P7K49_026492 [Saguinus oedipus]|uniref:Uncharacterized protein n=1 Tax=Saguinus oedipus TaxID=9490 RepID=A0ABQ9UDS0_SAGOE|nr:hypothetical protein P7K49_026492 [Saguinus oedipus]